jgi:DNA-binding NtrC family response regulator
MRGIGKGKSARVLIVDDNAILAFGMAKGLRQAGFEVIGPVATVAAAMRLLTHSECSVAVLDVRLGRGETSEPVAIELKARNIPFVTVTGYADEQCPPAFSGAPMLYKPARQADLIDALRRCLGVMG